MTYTAVGCHVFAGGFTQGVRKVFNVPAQFELHGLGKDTVEGMGIDFVNTPNREAWHEALSLYKNAVFVFGNPRCTAFSTLTGGYDDGRHGPWAKATCDIHDFAWFTVKGQFELGIWESVQQAYTTGRPLLDYLRDNVFVPNGYAIAHLFINAATFGNAQHRKRYFFAAYKRDRPFNIEPPDNLVTEHATVRDIIGRFKQSKPKHSDERPLGAKECKYNGNSYQRLTTDEWAMVPELRQGECLNVLHNYRPDVFEARGADGFADISALAQSKMPFSAHCIRRVEWDRACPTIHGSAGRFLHPELDRPLTVRELALLMGWDKDVLPKGWNPVGQIAKGVCPCAGEWLAKQALLYLDDQWGGENFESSYSDTHGEWQGQWFDETPDEKVFNITQYAPQRIPRKKDRDHVTPNTA